MVRHRLLFDVGVGRHAEEAAITLGHDVAAVRHLNPKMADEETLRLAALEDRIVITMDQDFGTLVYLEGHPRPPGVLLLRLDDATGREKASALSAVLLGHAESLMGNFAVLQRDRLRVRPLPQRGPGRLMRPVPSGRVQPVIVEVQVASGTGLTT